jgi:hypothetical protein
MPSPNLRGAAHHVVEYSLGVVIAVGRLRMAAFFEEGVRYQRGGAQNAVANSGRRLLKILLPGGREEGRTGPC